MTPRCCAEQALSPPRLWHTSICCTWPSYANHRLPLAHSLGEKDVNRRILGGSVGYQEGWRTGLGTGRDQGGGTAGSQWGWRARTCHPWTDTAGFSVLAAFQGEGPDWSRVSPSHHSGRGGRRDSTPTSPSRVGRGVTFFGSPLAEERSGHRTRGELPWPCPSWQAGPCRAVKVPLTRPSEGGWEAGRSLPPASTLFLIW